MTQAPTGGGSFVDLLEARCCSSREFDGRSRSGRRLSTLRSRGPSSWCACRPIARSSPCLKARSGRRTRRGWSRWRRSAGGGGPRAGAAASGHRASSRCRAVGALLRARTAGGFIRAARSDSRSGARRDVLRSPCGFAARRRPARRGASGSRSGAETRSRPTVTPTRCGQLSSVALNDKEGALDSGRMAVERAPSRSSARLALSYALQANIQLEAARDAAIQATEIAPNDGAAWARLAELRLMLDDVGGAVEAARRAAIAFAAGGPSAVSSGIRVAGAAQDIRCPRGVRTGDRPRAGQSAGSSRLGSREDSAGETRGGAR